MFNQEYIDYSLHKIFIIIEKTSQVNKSLMKLINKKIPLGRTNEGKKLVGKIINIVSKPVKSQIKNTPKVTQRIPTPNQVSCIDLVSAKCSI